ncbi:MAG TPA: hypothetical protein PLU58_02320 [Saprospiraceae bacterium]|nr:hypothetical protein [Saprospiraceae bacterium]
MKKNTTNNDLTLKEKLLYSLIGIGIVGGGVFFGRKLVLKGVANREEKKSFDDGTPATLAKQIKMAFENDGWWGTDTEKLRTTLREIQSKQVFLQVQASYKKLYNSNMITDMSDELQATEYNEMLQIIAQKPDKTGGKPTSPILSYDGWAKRLKAAFDKEYGFLPGTDEEAIKAVFNEMPTQKAFIMTGIVYNKLFASNVMTDLKGELEMWEYNDYMKIILSKPKG